MPGYKSRKREASSDDDEVVKPAKKTKTKTKASDEGRDDDGNAFWQLAPMRRLTISTFKGKTLVNIREYWTDQSGEMKPGKKGISLTIEQYTAMVEALPAVNAELESKGVKAPNLSSSKAKPAVQAAADEDNSDAPESPVKSKPKSKSKEKETKQKKKKMNIEATSDEEEAEEDELDDDEE
ncbi:ssDNA-binding transcriptional regulator [Xylariaceae sp. FL1272]|nr:ssDNA-binding transcriptional regulator [Xylariaceae sp. FL1272]